MNSNNHKDLIELTIWLGLDPDKVKQRIKKIADKLSYKNSTDSNIWLSLDSEKVKERINKITAKLNKVRLLEEDQLNSLNSSHQSESQDDQAGWE